MRIELSTLKGMKQWMDTFAPRTENASCDVSDPNHSKVFKLLYGFNEKSLEHVMHLIAPNGRTIVKYVHHHLEECNFMFWGMVANEMDVGGDPHHPVPESVLDTVTHIIAHTTWLSDGEEKSIPITKNIVLNYIYEEDKYQFMLYGNFICVSIEKDLEAAKDKLLRRLEFIVHGDQDPFGVYDGLGAALNDLLRGDE